MTIKIQGDKITFPDDSEQTTAYDGSSGGIPEAPIDGKQYGRQDAEWTEVEAQTPVTFRSGSINAGQTPPVGENFKIAFGTPETNEGGTFGGTYFTPNTEGWYQVSGSVFVNAPTTSRVGCLIQKNGNSEVATFNQGITANGGGGISTSGLVYCNGTTDKLSLAINCSETVGALGGAPNTIWFSAILSTGGGSGDSIWTEEGGKAVYDGTVKTTVANTEDALYLASGNNVGDSYVGIRGDNESGIKIRGGGSSQGGTIDFGGGLRAVDAGSLTFFTGTGGGATPERMKIASNGTVSTTQDITVNGVTVGKGSGDVATNTAVGITSLVNNTTGANNTSIGLQALVRNTEGNSNSSLGSNSLQQNTTGSNNTAVGYNALPDNTEGDFNTSLGFSSGTSLTTGSNNTLIGYNAQPSAPDVSNEVTIGNSDVNRVRFPFASSNWEGNAGELTFNCQDYTIKTATDKNVRVTIGTTETLKVSKNRVDVTDSFYVNGNVEIAQTLAIKGMQNGGGVAPNVHIGADGVLYSTVTTYVTEEEVDKKLAIKDKLNEKLSARLDSLEKKVK